MAWKRTGSEWNIILLLVSIVMWLFTMMGEYVRPIAQTSEGAKHVAAELSTDEARTREAMLHELYPRDYWQPIIAGSPIGVIVLLLLLRSVMDYRAARRKAAAMLPSV
jgi:hypothetical protein